MAFDFLSSLPPVFSAETPYYARVLVLAVLGWTAWVDAWTGRVARPWIWAGGVLAVFASQQWEGWYIAGVRLTVALAVYVFLRLINEGYYRIFKRDPYGYGDMRWSALAAYAFGVAPVLWAWAIGAWLGLLFMGGAWIFAFVFGRPRPEGYIHFAPFLFLGLLGALYARPYLGL